LVPGMLRDFFNVVQGFVDVFIDFCKTVWDWSAGVVVSSGSTWIKMVQAVSSRCC